MRIVSSLLPLGLALIACQPSNTGMNNAPGTTVTVISRPDPLTPEAVLAQPAAASDQVPKTPICTSLVRVISSLPEFAAIRGKASSESDDHLEHQYLQAAELPNSTECLVWESKATTAEAPFYRCQMSNEISCDAALSRLDDLSSEMHPCIPDWGSRTTSAMAQGVMRSIVMSDGARNVRLTVQRNAHGQCQVNLKVQSATR